MPNAPGWMAVLMIIGFKWYKRTNTSTAACCCSHLSTLSSFCENLQKDLQKMETHHTQFGLTQTCLGLTFALLKSTDATLLCVLETSRGETGSRATGTHSEAKVIATDCRAYEQPRHAFRVVMLNWWCYKSYANICTIPGCCGTRWPLGAPGCSFISTRSVWMKRQECPWKSFYKTLACLL